MKVLQAVIVKGDGMDKVLLKTDLPSPHWPYVGQFLSLSFNAAKNDGAVYVMNHWPDIPIEIAHNRIPYGSSK